MTYFIFLTLIDVNPDMRFFLHGQKFSADMYKRAENYDYTFETVIPTDSRFPNLMELLSTTGIFGYQYQTRIPVIISIEQTYFLNRNKTSEFSSFINNFTMVHEYFSNDYGIPPYRLDGRKILLADETGIYEELKYDALNQINFWETLSDSIVNGEGSLDLIMGIAAEKHPFDLEWKIYLNGIQMFFQNNFTQAVINCLTSIEAQITSPVEDWLLNASISSSDVVKNTLYDFSNPLKFDIYINTINVAPFKKYTIEERKKLISNFKVVNTLRNKIVHQGYKPDMSDAKNAIELTGVFLSDIWRSSRNF